MEPDSRKADITNLSLNRQSLDKFVQNLDLLTLSFALTLCRIDFFHSARRKKEKALTDIWEWIVTSYSSWYINLWLSMLSKEIPRGEIQLYWNTKHKHHTTRNADHFKLLILVAVNFWMNYVRWKFILISVGS